MWPRLLNAALGIWLMFAPAVLNYLNTSAATNDRVVGPLAAAFAIMAVWQVTRPLRWLNVLLGAWLILAPFVLGYEATNATINSIIVGLVMIPVALVRGPYPDRLGGGWHAVLHPVYESPAKTEVREALARRKRREARRKVREAKRKAQGARRLLRKGKGMTQQQQVVVVTGASAGVGRATAIEFAKRGAKVALLARGQAGLDGARRDVEAAGGQALTIQVDVADADAVERAAERVEAELGPIDVWVNNAMASVFSPVKEMTPDDFKRVTEVTYLGAVNGSLAALKRMLPRDRGIIVQVGSALAYRGIPLQAPYCGAKHAMQGFNDSLRSELLHDGSNVKVSMVQLPALNTPQFRWVKSRLPKKAQPVPPIYQPEVAARAIVFAADSGRREMSVGGMNTVLLWGNKVFPGFGDWYLSKNGYKGQQTNEPRDPGRPDNLYHPVDDSEDHGAHGVFDDRSKPHSRQLWLSEHRRTVGLATLGALGVLLLLRRNS